MKYEITDYEKLSLKGRFLFQNKLEKMNLDFDLPHGPYKEIVVSLDECLIEKVKEIFNKILEDNTAVSEEHRKHAYAQ
jgi:hypothetical protein